jgi:hypothetical protein
MIANIITSSVFGVLVLWFLLVAARDLSMLFRRPSKGLGTGFGRIWAVGHTAMLEAWAGRVWLLPVLWFIASLILMLAVRPFDESERMSLYIRVLFTSQELLLLVMIWVMACISFPRERERKIVITNASKPLSRLEIVLGKVVGFSATALLLILVMGAVSWVMLLVADQRIRSNARAEYQLAETDFRTKSRELKEAIPPPENKKRLAEEGSLFALNYTTVPKDGMSIVGMAETTPTGLVRYLKGGSMEQVIYRFSNPYTHNLPGEAGGDLGGPGQRPFFFFQFPVFPYVRDIPDKVLIHVTAVRARQRLRPQEKTLVLNLQEGGTATWEPDNVGELFSFPGQRDNGEIEVVVTCPTDGVFLQIRDGVPRENATSVTQFNVAASPKRDAGGWEVPLPNPKMRGFERRDKQQVSGPMKREIQKYGSNVPLEVAIFRFPASSLRDVPLEGDNFRLSLLADVDKEENGELDTIAWAEVYNENSPTERFDKDLTVIEKRSTELLVPKQYLGDPDPAKRGDLVVLLRCKTPGHWLSLLEDSVRLEKPPSPFVLNLLKSELVIFCEAVLLVVICVTCSVRLGWPVAMLTSATCYFLGLLRAFITELQDLGGLGALGWAPGQELSSSAKFVDHVLAAIWKILQFIVSLMPDFTRFEPLEFIAHLRNMPISALFVDAGWMALYSLPFIGVGYLLIRKQELG